MSAAGRVVEVDADRLPGWVQRFADRHGPVRTRLSPDEEPDTVVVEAADGARAELDDVVRRLGSIVVTLNELA